ncbi:hypothetical protein BT69DRAFT_1311196 [Atractiella rhizophila]|nr:hypothetical protein BT69DRAFT_1311196 [Atractiella rhizophila]
MKSAILSLSLAALALASPLETSHKRATVCNGRSELCGRSYGNTTFLMSHDSYAISTNVLNPARNQQVSIADQLGKYGVRALQAQAHMSGGVLKFCHTSCLLFDGGSVVDYLKKVKTFIDANPNEVYTLLFTNPESVALSTWDQAFVDSGIKPLTYVPPKYPLKSSEWPTLGSMIDSGKKVVVFMDYGANTNAYPYILPEFDFMWEPPFSVTDPSFPCKVDRISGSLSVQDHLYMINHNLNVKLISLPFRNSSAVAQDMLSRGVPLSALTGASTSPLGLSARAADDDVVELQKRATEVLVPDFFNAGTTNSQASILSNVNGCAPLAGGKATSFVMIDWVDIGAGKATVDKLNGF